MKRWPLLVIAAPAAVAIWSGWVALGELCGFGVIHPLPGILPAVHLNTAITLPVGLEAYAAYALAAWLGAHELPAAARRFAKWSAVGSLALGMAGQVSYHLLAAEHAHRAPWPVVVLVSCLPVAVLGLAAALLHLQRTPAVPGDVPAAAAVNGHQHAEAAKVFAAEISARTVPGIRRIRSELRCGQPRAREVQAYLKTLTSAP